MFRRRFHVPTPAAFTVAAVTAAACSSGDDDATPVTSTEQSPPVSTAAPTTTLPAATTPPAPTIAPPSSTSTSGPATTTTTVPPPTTLAALSGAVDAGEIGTTPDNDVPTVLVPGPYAVALLQPYAFETGEEIQVVLAAPDYVLVRGPAWSLEERAGSVEFMTLDGLVPPELAADESVRNVNGPARPEQMLATPVDFPAWIEAVPNVAVTDSVVIESPATTVRWWDVVLDVDADPTFGCAGDADCVGSFVSSPEWTGVYPLQAQNLQRVYLFDDLPDVFGLVDAREPEFFDRSVELMEMIVGSLAPTA